MVNDIPLKQINKDILHLAIPSIVANVTVPLLGLVDLSIVGHMGSERYIAAVAVGSMIFNVMYWLMGFFRMSTSGLTAQLFGRQTAGLSTDFSPIVVLLLRSLLTAIVIGLCFVLGQWPLRWVGIELMHPDQSIVGLVHTYFNICIWGAPAVLGLYVLTGWFIGMQNTRVPMIVSVSQNVFNIVVSLLLVYGFGMKIEGVALGTMLAQWAGFILALFYVVKTAGWLRLRQGVSLFNQGKSLGEQGVRGNLLSLNLAFFLRTVCLVAVNLFFTAMGARQGNLMLSVNTLLMTFFMIFSYFMDGFAYAGEALCGRYFGARQMDVFKNVCSRLLWWGGVMIMFFTTLYLFGGRPFLSVLTSETAVIALANRYFLWVVFVPLLGMAAFIYDGIFIGISASAEMLWATFIATVAFFAAFQILFPTIGNHALWLALLVYLALRGIILRLILRWTLVKMQRL